MLASGQQFDHGREALTHQRFCAAPHRPLKWPEFPTSDNQESTTAHQRLTEFELNRVHSAISTAHHSSFQIMFRDFRRSVRTGRNCSQLKLLVVVITSCFTDWVVNREQYLFFLRCFVLFCYQTSEGLFSAVSKPTFCNCSIVQQDSRSTHFAHVCIALASAKPQTFAFLYILKVNSQVYDFWTRIRRFSRRC